MTQNSLSKLLMTLFVLFMITFCWPLSNLKHQSNLCPKTLSSQKSFLEVVYYEWECSRRVSHAAEVQNLSHSNTALII